METGGPIVGGFLLQAAMRLRRSRALELLDDLVTAPRASPEEVREAQFRRLSDLLAHAEARVPYYREMFRSLGIRSCEIRSLEEFAALPVLTKAIVQERQRDLIRDDAAPDNLFECHSGGSTGVPLTFYHDRDSMAASEAGTFRNLMQCGWHPGEMIAFFWGGNDMLSRMPHWEFELRQTVRRCYHFNAFHSGPAQMERWLRKWGRLHARVALGYASTIARFAEYIETTGQRIPALKGVFTTAEKLYPQQRGVISRVFGCKVYDCYGSSEVRNIAAECPHGQMHVNTDFVVLEVDRAAASSAGAGGAATAAGYPRGAEGVAGGGPVPRPFIVTSLWNRAMPFIRYRNEDCGGLLEGACDCGSNFPLMQLDIARVNDNFVFPGGRVVHGLRFTYLMYGSEGIANFQFHQTAPDAMTLWIVPSQDSALARARTIRGAVEQIKALSSEGVKVEVREVEAIPLSAAGKHRFTRSDVSASDLR